MATPELVREASLAVVAVLGFALLFSVPRRSLLACAATGVVGFLVRSVASDLGASPPAAAFTAAGVVALMGEIFARGFLLPTTVFVVPGFLPLLPGVAATRAVIQLMHGDYAQGGPNVITVALNAFAIAAGIGVLGSAARSVRLRRREPEG